MNIYFFFYSAIMIFLMFLFSLFLIILTVIEKVFFLKVNIRQWVPRLYFYIALKILRASIKVEGLENIEKKSYLILVNHTSMMDIFLLSGYFPYHLIFMPKDSLFKIVYFGFLMKLLNYIPIYRTDFKKTQQSLRTAQEAMKKDNMSILLFPEGTRSQGEILPFKNGFIRIMKGLDEVEVLPVVIEGAEKVLRTKTMKLYPGKIQLSFLKPIHFDLKKCETREDENVIKEKIYKVMKKEHERLKKISS